ncbi:MULTISPECIES: ferritin-like domain-containing protein [unclassified Paenibacillus]|uniref:Ferritin family protein n=1 Tax=Paenibacillus provencensis TaxID=441151 RepID=A0ABW3PMK7_9BACL|nr:MULTISPECIES: ferritin-like domain-containing protein [unclassified Paenibacillus]MCM3127411.1 ferritin-like domain-containing protein [Paenibacillus sp. MER 78]SFS43050.1 Rubrerythrin [Paenibacillus sp. 453mf]
MYLPYPYCYRSAFTPIWSISTTEAIELIKEAVQGERNDELFYNSLINLAPDPYQATIITGIRNDEREHNRMFRQMYTDLTGQEITGVSNEQPEQVESYLSELQKAFQGELEAVEKYRKIWFGLPQSIYKDTVWGIILDEQKHADKYNNLIAYNLSKK